MCVLFLCACTGANSAATTFETRSRDTASVVVGDSTEFGLLQYGMTNKAYEQQKVAASAPWEHTNPLSMALELLIRGYQVIFSSQDGSSCQFRPSCSHFAAESVKEYGPVQGTLMASDRLLRCNPYTEGRYPKADDYFHNKDPIERHVLWGDHRDE